MQFPNKIDAKNVTCKISYTLCFSHQDGNVISTKSTIYDLRVRGF